MGQCAVPDPSPTHDHLRPALGIAGSWERRPHPHQRHPTTSAHTSYPAQAQPRTESQGSRLQNARILSVRTPHQKVSAMREHTVRILVATLPAGDPRMSAQIASRATRMFCADPRMWILVSARQIRVRVAFSIVNFVLPLFPARRPMHRARCSPRRVCNAWHGGRERM